MPTSYSRTQIALHWVIFLLFALNYIVSDGMGRALRTFSEGGTPEGITPMIHVWSGIAVLALTLVRLALRLTRGVPETPELRVETESVDVDYCAQQVLLKLESMGLIAA